MIGHGVSSRSSHSCRSGPDDTFSEVVDPVADLDHVLGEFN